MWGIELNINLLIGVIILLCVFLILPYSYFTKSVSNELTHGPLKLEDSPNIGNSSATTDFLVNTNTGTIQAFVYPMPIQRTGVAIQCGDGSTVSSEPDCSTGRYGICKCDGSDCSKCSHSGYVNLLNISNIVKLELLASPDAGRQKSASVQLVVRSLREKETVEETFVLPAIPFQKWTMVTISREGRRFDVYYNNKLILSKRAQHTLDIKSAFGSIIGGDSGLNGKIAVVRLSPEKYSLNDVELAYSTYADTTGAPYLNESSSIFKTFKSTLSEIPCADGSCLKGPTIRPTSPLMDWQTSYA